MTTRLYRTRKQAAQGCRANSEAAFKFAAKAIEKANEGTTRTAWEMADTAKMWAQCAMSAHEELWEITKGNLTDEEFEAFEQAEIATIKARSAAMAAAAAVAKAQAEYDRQREVRR